MKYKCLNPDCNKQSYEFYMDGCCAGYPVQCYLDNSQKRANVIYLGGATNG